MNIFNKLVKLFSKRECSHQWDMVEDNLEINTIEKAIFNLYMYAVECEVCKVKTYINTFELHDNLKSRGKCL